MVPNPVPTSPTSSTPEPDTSTVPLDNATIPNSALQAPTGTTRAHDDVKCVVKDAVKRNATSDNVLLLCHFIV